MDEFGNPQRGTSRRESANARDQGASNLPKKSALGWLFGVLAIALFLVALPVYWFSAKNLDAPQLAVPKPKPKL